MNIQLDILRFSYWEHFKAAKELSQVYPPEHPRLIQITKVMNDLIIQINFLDEQK